ncbi:MAG: P-II family nitrogen regulator [Oscillospiraceae bacterium]|nr:P-II family nitrogen regulator [Oscillospiraceae bacterium]
MDGLYIMVTIVTRAAMPPLTRLYRDMGADVNFITLAHGTVSGQLLTLMGIDGSEKAVCHTVITGDTFEKLKPELKKRHLDIPGTGIVFLLPMSAVGGKKQLSYLLGGQEYRVSEESVMKETKQELIVVIGDQGYTDLIMDAARAAGAAGGTVLSAKGTGTEAAAKFFGFTIAAEKEIIYIVASTGLRDGIMRSIIDNSGIKTKAHAICFSLPVSDAMGLRTDG